MNLFGSLETGRLKSRACLFRKVERDGVLARGDDMHIEGCHGSRPDETLLVVSQLSDDRKDPRDADAVGAHRHRHELAVLIQNLQAKRLGEEVAAYIRVNDQDIDFEELKTYCKKHLAYYKIPKFIKIVDEYPLTVTGKIQKFQLKKWAENDFELDL